MPTVLALFGILGALLAGAMVPGPSFVLVSRVAARSSRAVGLAAAMGMGLGGVAFATLALLGLVALLTQVQWLSVGLRVAGGLYLMHVGLRIWRGATRPLGLGEVGARRPASLRRSFALGLLTQVSNPKTAIAYASVFAALLPAAPPAWLVLAVPPLVFAVEVGWYAAVALLFSSAGPQAFYLGSKRWIDRTAGAIMGALGARLVAETVLSRP